MGRESRDVTGTTSSGPGHSLHRVVFARFPGLRPGMGPPSGGGPPPPRARAGPPPQGRRALLALHEVSTGAKAVWVLKGFVWSRAIGGTNKKKKKGTFLVPNCLLESLLPNKEFLLPQVLFFLPSSLCLLPLQAPGRILLSQTCSHSLHLRGSRAG